MIPNLQIHIWDIKENIFRKYIRSGEMFSLGTQQITNLQLKSPSKQDKQALLLRKEIDL